MDAETLLLVFLAFAAGGVLKGATGVGTPLLAVPLMATLRDVPFAVAVFVLPNIVPNLWQYWAYRRSISSPVFTWMFALSGAAGAAIGTFALVGIASNLLQLALGLILGTYVLFRLIKPRAMIATATASRLAVPVGTLAGALQGATGISAPLSLTFLSSIGIARKDFMATVSLFFVGLGVAQLPMQIALEIMTLERFFYSALALIPLMTALPVGTWLGSKIQEALFQKIVLAILLILAVRLVSTGLTGS